MLKGLLKFLIALNLLLLGSLSLAHTTQVMMNVRQESFEYYQLNHPINLIQLHPTATTLSSTEKGVFFELEAIEIEEEQEEHKLHPFKRFSDNICSLIYPFSFEPLEITFLITEESATDSGHNALAKASESLTITLQVFRI